MFISSGSRDRTKEILGKLRGDLEMMGVRHAIVTDPAPKNTQLDRITYLSELRNRALAPLLARSNSTSDFGEETIVVFFNDIYFKVCFLDATRFYLSDRTPGT